MYINLSITFADVAKHVLDRCVVSNPEKRDPKNKNFEVVLDYSFVEDHQNGDARWLSFFAAMHNGSVCMHMEAPEVQEMLMN